MQLMVHGHNVDITPDVYSHVERKVLSALGRFGRTVVRVAVRLHANAGPAEPVTTCHILVELHPSGGLGVGEAALTPETAVDRASDRAGSAVRRQLSGRRALPPSRWLAYRID